MPQKNNGHQFDAGEGVESRRGGGSGIFQAMKTKFYGKTDRDGTFCR